MAVFSAAPLRRVYAQLQSSVGTVVNNTGTWDPTSAKLIPHIKMEIKRLTGMIESEYKTGTGSMLAGVANRNSGSFSGEIDIMPSGTAGTKSNCSPILASIFGADGTASAGVSVTYALKDQNGSNNVPPLTLAIFNESGASTTQQFGYGGVSQNFTISLGGNGSARLTFDGMFFYVLESDNWSNEDTVGKGGLSAFPTEPANPALTGNIIPSFAASVTFGGSATAEFRSAQIKGTTGRSLRTDGVGSYPDTSISQGRRRVAISSLKFQDSDGSALAAVKNAIRSKSAMDVIVAQGIVGGYILTHTLKQVQFTDATYTESGDNIDVDFGDAPAHASALANTNEYSLVLT